MIKIAIPKLFPPNDFKIAEVLGRPHNELHNRFLRVVVRCARDNKQDGIVLNLLNRYLGIPELPV
jgi:putative lipoic acid-binding regulatory protein